MIITQQGEINTLGVLYYLGLTDNRLTNKIITYYLTD